MMLCVRISCALEALIKKNSDAPSSIMTGNVWWSSEVHLPTPSAHNPEAKPKKSTHTRGQVLGI